MKTKLSPQKNNNLLSDSCVGLGICLPAGLIQRLRNSLPTNALKFMQVIYVAEGFDPAFASSLYNAVLAWVERAFREHPQ